mmetsp:Transcript_10222/g.32422  ORF Transcript_10222/g.32422 Transcript_10222/m.32422 type:complete len:223 (-) Transcript_10222:224-892(-)
MVSCPPMETGPARTWFARYGLTPSAVLPSPLPGPLSAGEQRGRWTWARWRQRCDGRCTSSSHGPTSRLQGRVVSRPSSHRSFSTLRTATHSQLGVGQCGRSNLRTCGHRRAYGGSGRSHRRRRWRQPRPSTRMLLVPRRQSRSRGGTARPARPWRGSATLDPSTFFATVAPTASPRLRIQRRCGRARLVPTLATGPPFRWRIRDPFPPLMVRLPASEPRTRT